MVGGGRGSSARADTRTHTPTLNYRFLDRMFVGGARLRALRQQTTCLSTSSLTLRMLGRGGKEEAKLRFLPPTKKHP